MFLRSDPEKSRPRPHITFLYRLNFQQHTIYILVLPSGLFHSGFSHNTVQNSRPSHSCETLCTAHPFELIMLKKFVRRIGDEAPHYAVFSNLVVLYPFKHKYFFQHPILKHP